MNASGGSDEGSPLAALMPLHSLHKTGEKVTRCDLCRKQTKRWNPETKMFVCKRCEKPTFTESSGNVFLDLGFSPEEAERLLKESEQRLTEKKGEGK